jgi:hypothetical protein
MALAYALCVLIVTLPFGLAMFNRVGAVMTLMRYQRQAHRAAARR